MRDYLRGLPVFAGAIATFDARTAPDDPVDLFVEWLESAVRAGVPEPHAMTLSTCDASGLPDGRTLILKDLDSRGWWFSSNSASAKGSQLAETPAAALTFYWPQVGRQVRVRGPVIAGTAEESSRDFRARGRGARAVALASRESQPLDDPAACAKAVADAELRLAADPDLVAPGWQTYAVAAEAVEFWTAEVDRQHVRLQYRRSESEWRRTLLWP